MPRSLHRDTLGALRWALLAALALPGCAPAAPSARWLHVVDGELVHSRPAPPDAYADYLRARLAMNAEPPDHATALRHLRRAQRYDPRDPHLWATRAQAETLAGDYEQARASAERSLALAPGYPLAQRVLAQLDGGPKTAAVAAADRPQ